MIRLDLAFAPLLALLILTGCGADADIERIQKKWADAVVIRICVDGTRIYRLNDGTYNAGAFVDPVEDPNTVCSSK
jgi:hypothetical protein